MYRRNERLAGETHYPLSKMLSLAFDGITSLSVKPITFIALSGIIAGLIGLAGIIWAFIAALSGHSVDGWASAMCVVCFLGGIQLLCLWIIGEYVGKAYMGE